MIKIEKFKRLRICYSLTIPVLAALSLLILWVAERNSILTIAIFPVAIFLFGGAILITRFLGAKMWKIINLAIREFSLDSTSLLIYSLNTRLMDQSAVHLNNEVITVVQSLILDSRRSFLEIVEPKQLETFLYWLSSNNSIVADPFDKLFLIVSEVLFLNPESDSNRQKFLKTIIKRVDGRIDKTKTQPLVDALTEYLT